MPESAIHPIDPGASRPRSWWGWGYTDAHPDDAECAALGALLPGTLARPLPIPRVCDLAIGRPGVKPPPALAHLVTDDPEARAAHAMGKAYRDVIRALRGRPAASPTLWPARPTTRRWPTCWSGPASTVWPSSPSAAAPQWSAAWSTAVTPTRLCCRWI